MKKIIFGMSLLFLLTGIAHADQVIYAINESTSLFQQYGLALCSFGGVVGGIMMAFNNDSGSSWMAKAILAVSAIGAMPFIVKAIGGIFNIG